MMMLTKLVAITLAIAALAVGVQAQSTTPLYEYVGNSWGPCVGSQTVNGVPCGTGFNTREVICIRKGSYNLPLPTSFCADLTALPATKQCTLTPCATAASSVQAPPNVICPAGQAPNAMRIFKAEIAVYSAAASIQDGVRRFTQFPTDFGVNVDQTVNAGPVVINYILYNRAGVKIYDGSKVGQAMTDNSHVLFAIEDLALPCDTVTKGKGTFSISMNQISPASNLYIDPEYFSRQQIQFFWPDNTVAESYDMYTAVKGGVSVLGPYANGNPFTGRQPMYQTDYMPFRFQSQSSS